MRKIHSPVLRNAAEASRVDLEHELCWFGEEESKTYVERYKAESDWIRPGYLVKVTDFEGAFTPGEQSFWVKVTKCLGNGVFVGRVESHLFAWKPYNFGELIYFGAENICGIIEESDEQ